MQQKMEDKWLLPHKSYFYISGLFLYNLRFLEALRMFVQWRPNHRFPTQALNLEAELEF